MKTKSNIIHLVEFIPKRLENGKWVSYPYYKCIHACGVANPMKSTVDEKEVTCRNCIKWFIENKDVIEKWK